MTGRPDLLRRLVRTGRTGWYLRVLQPGQVPVAGPIQVSERHPAGVSVLEAHWAAYGVGSRTAIERVLAVEALAASWRDGLLDELRHTHA